MLFWKFVKKTKIYKLEEIDLWSGKAEIDNLEGTWEVPVAKNWLQKVRHKS